MNSKKILCISLLLFILCIGAVSAANQTDTLSDNDDKAITDENDEILSISQEDEKLGSSCDFNGTTFDELQDVINEESHDTINLKNDVKQTGNESMLINKPMLINGNGHTLDAAGKSRIFIITADVILNNITFINGISGDNYE